VGFAFAGGGLTVGFGPEAAGFSFAGIGLGSASADFGLAPCVAGDDAGGSAAGATVGFGSAPADFGLAPCVPGDDAGGSGASATVGFGSAPADFGLAPCVPGDDAGGLGFGAGVTAGSAATRFARSDCGVAVLVPELSAQPAPTTSAAPPTISPTTTRVRRGFARALVGGAASNI
jgi:hypothetical protein